MSCQQQSPPIQSPADTPAMPSGAYLQDWQRTKDPALGRPAPERLLPIVEYIKRQQMKKSLPGDSTNAWVERGPFDVGGRTRAIMFDPNDATAHKVWAGGVTGGLWAISDITSSGTEWENVNDFWDNLTVTCLAYDPNSTTTFYAGTGESYTGSGRGAGIWKSTDGGTSWSQLSSTADFYYVNDIVVRNEGGSSVVYAGVTGRYYEGAFHGSAQAGLQRSTDGGSSWSQVLPDIPGQSFPAAASDLEIAANNDLWVGTDVSPYGPGYRGGGRIYSSTNGTSFSLEYSTTVGDDYGRVELACAPSDANYVYAIIEDSSEVKELVRTTNAGSSWSSLSMPNDADNGIPASDFSRGQAGYDLISAVHPTDRDEVIVGAIDLFRSANGGSSWTQISKWSNNPGLHLLDCPYVHADQHQIVFRPGHNDEVVFGTDGGIFYCSDITSAATSNVTQPRNNGYNVTQFYAAAIHPGLGINYYLAGSQDNGTQRFNKSGLGTTVEANGGDGAFCFVDANEPDTQIVSYVYNDYSISLDGGQSFSPFFSGPGGSFINPAAYDSQLNILYSAYSSGGIVVAPVGGSPAVLGLSLGSIASAFTVSPHTTASTTLYIGTEAGSLFKLTDADNAAVAGTDISGGSFSGAISSIDLAGSEDTIAVSFFNYGVTSVWYSTDGGTSWSSREGNLPDMPIRWFMFHPTNRDEAIVATELGVWGTSDFTSSSPTWTPSTSGLANVRVDMLRRRESDQQVVAATFGRGLFTSDAFAEQAPVAEFIAVTEQAGIEMPVQFTDLSSGNPTSWAWSFAPYDVIFLDGTTASSQHPKVQFTQAGSYTVSLTATNNHGADAETKTGYLTVSAAKALPYSQDFDAFSLCTPVGGCGENCSLSDDWLNASSETDDSDWITYTGSTGSSNTGPSGDHTSGSGNYLYTEASTCFNREMLLYSPVIDLYNAQNPSLSFAYHMYGLDMGELEVKIYSGDDWVSLWDNYGNDGNFWQTATIDLGDYSGQQVVLRFAGATGSDFTSDMAIDDVVIGEAEIRWDGGGATSNWSDADNWSTDVVPADNSSVILDNTYVAGSYSINMDVEATLYNLEIDAAPNTISLTGGNFLNVTGIVDPNGGTLSSGGLLVLKAVSEIQYGQVDTGNGSITGNVSNEWYYNGPDGYRHISSPVNCNLSEISADFTRLQFSSGSNGSIWGWDPDTSYWYAPTGASTAFDESFSVYMGNSYGLEFTPLPFVFDASGSLNTGAQMQTLTYSVGDPADFVDPGENAGWNFMKNPYPSYLDWDRVTADGSFPAELSTTVYVWDESLGSGGAYASYNATTSTSVNGGTEKIAKGQAAWIQLNSSPGGGSTSLNLSDNMRSTNSAPKAKGRHELGNQLQISVSQSGIADKLCFAEFPSSTLAYDFRTDHLEMDNGNYRLSVFYDEGQRRLAYNCLYRYHFPQEFTVESPSSEPVELNVSTHNFFRGNKPHFLKNLSTGELHSLDVGTYHFTPADKQTNFLLMINEDDDRKSEAPVRIATGQNLLYLQFADRQQFRQAFLYDTSGRLVLRKNVSGFTEIRLSTPASGVYILYLQGPGDEYSQKVVLWE